MARTNGTTRSAARTTRRIARAALARRGARRVGAPQAPHPPAARPDPADLTKDQFVIAIPHFNFNLFIYTRTDNYRRTKLSLSQDRQVNRVSMRLGDATLDTVQSTCPGSRHVHISSCHTAVTCRGSRTRAPRSENVPARAPPGSADAGSADADRLPRRP